MYPKAGGQYVFLRESMGPLMGFLYGWTLFLVIQTGTIAAVAVAFGRFLSVLVPQLSPQRFAWSPALDVTTPGGPIEIGLSPQRLVALASVWTLTLINLRGVREGKIVQTTLTVAKAGALAFLILLGLTIGRNATAMAANFADGHFAGHVELGWAFVLAFGAAMVGSLFSSDAWNNVTFAAAEVKDAKKNLPRALFLGTTLVSLLYVSANLSYVCMLPLRGDPDGASVLARGIEHATQDRVGTAAAEVIFGPGGATIMAIAILVSTFGCNNGLILAGARVYYAMAKDGLFFRGAGVLTARHVPAAALVAQGIWVSFLCLTGTYGQLLNYVIFAALLFYVTTMIGLFVLRAKRPDLERPYKVIGYPYVPALFTFFAGAVAAILLLAPKTRAQALSGLVLVLLGIPVYFAWRRTARPATDQ
jgi:APA family basic amino acid/polyamine antiporter